MEYVNMADKIKTWLKDEDVHYNRIEDNSTDLHITLWFSKDIRLEAIVWNDKLTISSNVLYFSEDIKNLLLVNESYCDELDLLYLYFLYIFNITSTCSKFFFIFHK